MSLHYPAAATCGGRSSTHHHNKIMKKLRNIFGQECKLAASSSNTKLYAEDYEEVQRRLVGGRTESAELRDLIRSGLQRERYKQAADDPAIRTLLRTFQDMISRSLAEVEGRLMSQIQIESSLAFNYLSKMYPNAVFAAEALSQLPADTAPDELREQARKHYTNLYDEIQEEAGQFTERMVKQHNEATAKVRETRQGGASLPRSDAVSQKSE